MKMPQWQATSWLKASFPSIFTKIHSVPLALSNEVLIIKRLRLALKDILVSKFDSLLN